MLKVFFLSISLLDLFTISRYIISLAELVVVGVVLLEFAVAKVVHVVEVVLQ